MSDQRGTAVRVGGVAANDMKEETNHEDEELRLEVGSVVWNGC